MGEKREAEIARAAEHLVRSMWRKHVPTAIDKLCNQESIGYTQADIAIRRAFAPYVAIAEQGQAGQGEGDDNG